MFSVVTNIYNKKTKAPTLMELFRATGNLKKVFWQLAMFDVCTTGDTAHIEVIFKFLPHTRVNIHVDIMKHPVLFLYNTSKIFSAPAASALATLPHVLRLWKLARCLNLLNQPLFESLKPAVGCYEFVCSSPYLSAIPSLRTSCFCLSGHYTYGHLLLYHTFHSS
jgi:hypothetical protein